MSKFEGIVASRSILLNIEISETLASCKKEPVNVRIRKDLRTVDVKLLATKAQRRANG